MQKPNLPEISATDSKVVAQIKASELKGLWINPQTLGTEENLCGEIIKEYEGKEISDYRLTYSMGDDSYLEVTFVIFSKEDSNFNLHIDQELMLFEENGELSFECPLSDDSLECDTLYLRKDYPLFGSAEFLNIKL